MSRSLLVAALWGATIVAGAWGALASWRALPAGPAPSPMNWRTPQFLAPLPRDSFASAAAVVIDGDPFRLERRPASVAYRPGWSEMPPPPPAAPAPPKPVLAVSGIVGGPPWQALLDGVPGHPESVLVHAGDTIAGLHVRAVTQTTVTVTGLDTAWTLSLKDAWP